MTDTSREALIKDLRSIDSRHLKMDGEIPLEMLDFYIAATLGLHNAANMLEADAQFDTWAKNPYTLALQKSISENYEPKQAQQVAVPEPLSDEKLRQLMDIAFDEHAWKGTGHLMVGVARAIEAAHGIGAKP